MSPHRSPLHPPYILPTNATSYPPLSPSRPTHHPPSLHHSSQPHRSIARSTTPPYPPPPHQTHRKNASSGNSATFNSSFAGRPAEGHSSNGTHGRRPSQHREIVGWQATDTTGASREGTSRDLQKGIDRDIGPGLVMGGERTGER